MRITREQACKILHIARQRVGDDVTVWLYGSRLDDNQRGGDLDLLLESTRHITLLQRADLKLALELELGIPVDILTYRVGSAPSAFQSIARAQAVRLDQVA